MKKYIEYIIEIYKYRLSSEFSLKYRKATGTFLLDATCQAVAFSLVETREQVLSRDEEVVKCTTFQMAYKIVEELLKTFA